MTSAAGAAPRRSVRGSDAQRLGVAAETAVCVVLEREGWTVLGRRVRTAAGEIDIVAEREGLLAVVEVKARNDLAEAAAALQPRQQARLIAAADLLLAANPGWGRVGVRFDVFVVDGKGTMRRIVDAFRVE